VPAILHRYFRDNKRLFISSWEWFCSSEDFKRHSFTAFSAALNSAPKSPSLLLYLLFPRLPKTRIPWQSRAQYNITV
jgi:hypothetical protein